MAAYGSSISTLPTSGYYSKGSSARRAGKIEVQRMLMPMVIELAPRQIVIYEKIAEELAANGFEVEPMGPRSVAIQAVPAGIVAGDADKLLTEILDGIERENAAISIETLQAKIAASTACHAAIKVNMPWIKRKWNGCWQNWRKRIVR